MYGCRLLSAFAEELRLKQSEKEVLRTFDEV
jgi:hypothetical protein